ncbi:B12-binding domain-containing radical SAM protein [bacterium]|nr:B12-binding domain-containing radical SAM protein [candidate division CSSED10-310 bacterium]
MSGSHDAFRVLLIRPPYTRIRGIGQAPYFPMGIGSMVAVLNALPNVDARLYYADNPGSDEKPIIIDKAGVFAARSHAQNVYFDALDNSDHRIWKEVRQVLDDFRPNLVGISVLTPETGSALNVTVISKEQLPDTPVVWGGVHPTFALSETLAIPGVDYVVAGEGEITLREMVLSLQAGKLPAQIPGLFHRNSDLQHSTQRGLQENLDLLPIPDRHAVFFPERFTPVAMGSLMHSRGCPWRCGFCSSRRFWQERVRFRSAGSVLDEILAIHRDFGIRIFTFWDDAFTIDRLLTESLCESILRSGLKIAWRTATRLDLLDEGLLKLMKRAGCFQVELGIESGSPRMSELIRKDIDLDAAPAVIDRTNRHGIACGVFMMAGFPDETRDDLMQTLSFIQRIKPAEIVLNILDPMPGSEQFERAIEMKLLPEHIDYSRFPLWPDAHYMMHVDRDEFNKIIEDISGYVFRYNSSRTAMIRRARPEIAQLLRTDRKVLLQKVSRFIGRRFLRRL